MFSLTVIASAAAVLISIAVGIIAWFFKDNLTSNKWGEPF